MVVTYSAVLAAAGAGRRFGGNKLREKVGGKAVLSHSLDLFDSDEDCQEIILVVSAELREWIEGNPLIFSSPKLKLVDGGTTRAESTAAGVRSASARIVAIHDAARPNVGEELLARLKAAVQPECGAVPGLPLSDTLAYAAGPAPEDAPAEPAADDWLAPKKKQSLPQISGHPQRGGLYLIQTPQLFYRDSYLEALSRLSSDTGALSLDAGSFTDDSSLYHAAGYKVSIVEGRSANLKLTTAEDLKLLHKLMGTSEKKGKDRYGGLGW
ncbi:2-C-methyl-D-erythritol 4-phosphate cytidylyltransferase [bacterium]|nr:2-C-methyl-D-erythritol 4-phosphate cytidylyltransferase [bacterium]